MHATDVGRRARSGCSGDQGVDRAGGHRRGGDLPRAAQQDRRRAQAARSHLPQSVWHNSRRRPQERHVGARARPCPRARRRQRARADAIGLEAAQSGKWYGGVDTDAIQTIYAPNRAEVEAEASAKGMTGDQMNAAVLARNSEIDEAHKQHYRTEAGDAGPGLKASFEKNLKGPALDLALGLQEQNWDRADAARLELERRSFITTTRSSTRSSSRSTPGPRPRCVSTRSTTSRTGATWRRCGVSTGTRRHSARPWKRASTTLRRSGRAAT